MTNCTGDDSRSYREVHNRVTTAVWFQLEPLTDQIDDQGCISYEMVWPILRSCGALGLLLPVSYGGSGLNFPQYLALISEFEAMHPVIGLAVQTHNVCSYIISGLGGQYIRDSVLRGAAIGERSPTIATEARSCNPDTYVRATAVRQGDRYVLNGRNSIVENANLATHFVVIAETQPELPSMFVLDRDALGLNVELLNEVKAANGMQHGQLMMTDASVPSWQLVGFEGDGLRHFKYIREVCRVLRFGTGLGWKLH